MKRFESFIDRLSINFSGLDQTLEEYSPVSEKGKVTKNKLETYVQGDEKKLEEHHQRLDYAIEQYTKQEASIDRIRYFLKNLPRIDDMWEMPMSQAEFALLANFRFNHEQIRRELVSLSLLDDWLVLCEPNELDDSELGVEVKKGFYLQDEASIELSVTRSAIRNLQRRIEDNRKKKIQKISLKHGLSEALEEWIIDRSDVDKLEQIRRDKNLVLINESISTLKFGLKQNTEQLNLLKEYDDLLVEERQIERHIYADKERVIARKKALWLEEQDKLCRLDHLLAQAEIAIRYKAVRPKVSEGYRINIENGRHVPFVATLQQEKRYTPLNITLDHQATILSGTNMGGKTVVLQSVCWFQALVQLGFFVPAQQMSTALFTAVDVSASTGESLGGLSGFGREIDRLKTILCKRENKVLFLIDEPGRTTRVREGRAIVQAVIDVLELSPSMIFISTHLDNIDGNNIGRLKMAGLGDIPENMEPSRNLLQSIMDYRVLEYDENEKIKLDAIKVAEILGLDFEIIERAKQLLDKD